MVTDTKAYLISYRKVERRLYKIDARLDDLLAEATRTTSAISDVKVQGGSTSSAVEDAAVERVDLMHGKRANRGRGNHDKV